MPPPPEPDEPDLETLLTVLSDKLQELEAAYDLVQAEMAALETKMAEVGTAFIDVVNAVTE